MILSIRLFATLKDLTGHSSVQIELPEHSTVDNLLDQLIAEYPKVAIARNNILVAINKIYASPETIIASQDDIALFPPVSGGSDILLPHPTYFALSESEPDLTAIHAQIKESDIGSIVTFTGSVRGKTARAKHPEETLSLEYEAYNEMALTKMSQIACEIWEQWPLIKGIAIVQRIGTLAVGDITTIVACASAHRDQGAFQAARYGIDRLKEIVPVWKKEIGPDQSHWIEGDYHPTEKDNR